MAPDGASVITGLAPAYPPQFDNNSDGLSGTPPVWAVPCHADSRRPERDRNTRRPNPVGIGIFDTIGSTNGGTGGERFSSRRQWTRG